MGSTPGELEQTVAADSAVTTPLTLGNTQVRTTVLPRRLPDGAAIPAATDRRFQQVRALGAGGMG
jgi:hypothetical protein